MTGAISPAATSVGTVLGVEGVRKTFKTGPPWHRRRLEVLRGASLEVAAGELVGLVGENGSGKSVLMQIIVGLLPRDAGTVKRSARLGYCPQVAAPMGQAYGRGTLRAVCRDVHARR
jgi:ABC-type multidrug transport system ATPase subunit